MFSVHVQADGNHLIPCQAQRAGAAVFDFRLEAGHFLQREGQFQILLVPGRDKEVKLRRSGGGKGFGTRHVNGFVSIQSPQRRGFSAPTYLGVSGESERRVLHMHVGDGAFLPFHRRELKPNHRAQALEGAGGLTGRNNSAHRQFIARVRYHGGRHGKRHRTGIDGEGIGRIIGVGQCSSHFQWR